MEDIKTADKMKVEIWSDIMCPFCYIGKRKFEAALATFEHSDGIEVEWHSFQLDPSIQYQPGRDLYTYLAEMKGQSKEWSIDVHNQLTQSAKQVGLDYHFDKAVIANSFDAHRLIQLAKKYDKGDDAEERLFSAYFTEGKNVSDHATLATLGEEIGLNRREVEQVLAGTNYSDAVRHDIEEARQIGVRGVPFFVMNRKYAVAGAQQPQAFLQTLQKSFGEWREEHPVLQFEGTTGEVCEPGGDCK